MKITITHSSEYGFKVSNEAGEHTGPLRFDEVLGQVVSLCWPLARPQDGHGPLYAMETDAGWDERRRLIKAGRIDAEPNSVTWSELVLRHRP